MKQCTRLYGHEPHPYPVPGEPGLEQCPGRGPLTIREYLRELYSALRS